MKTQIQTQTKHTPGPWYATTCGTDIHVQSASINEDNYVCKVYGTLNDDANAALIAAAPLMLEALREVDRAWAGDGITMAAAFESVWLAMKAAEGKEL